MTEAERIAEWTARAQEGDTSAFESLYETYGKRVYYFCRCLLGEEEAAIDATRSVFVYAWRNLRALPAGQTFYRWICGNAFYFAKIALAGLRGAGVTVEEADGDPTLFESMMRQGTRPSDEINVRRSHLDTVTDALCALPDGDRICVLLYDYACFPVEEVAGIVGCSVDTVKCRVYSGHAAICGELDVRTPGDGELFRPFLDKLIRTCGKNCTLPEAVTVRIREGLAAGADSEIITQLDGAVPPSVANPGGSAPQGRLSGVMINRICIVLGLLFAGALTYILYWFLSAPSAPAQNESSAAESSFYAAQSSETTSDVLSTVSEESLSGEESTVSGDESEQSTPDTSAPESSSPESSAVSEASSQTPQVTEPQPLPRVTTNLRLRSTPDASVSDNYVTTIPEGAHIDILETVTGEDGALWYKARYTVSAGFWYEGYCSAEYVQTEE